MIQIILIVLKMKTLIFSDLDGTFLNHDDYSYSNLKKFISKIKKQSEIIFTSSKTFCEMVKLYEKLNICFPFIVENGGCIFFPQDYLNFKLVDQNFFEHENYLGLQIGRNNLNKSKNNIKKINFSENFKFSFFSELNDNELIELTNLEAKNVEDSKKRQFSDPIYWKDTKIKLQIFKKKLKEKKITVSEGGRFLHFNLDCDKGKAVHKFLKIYKKHKSKNILTISLGDSENDLSMLELTNYSCIIKSSKKKKKLFKKRY